MIPCSSIYIQPNKIELLQLFSSVIDSINTRLKNIKKTQNTQYIQQALDRVKNLKQTMKTLN